MLAGEIYWLEFRGAGSEPHGRRPALIVQGDPFNRSAIRTAIVAAITSNLKLAAMPGNVRLARGEGNLRRASVVNVSQLATIDRPRLTDLVGSLRPSRLREVRRGLALVLGTEPDEV